MSYNAIWTPHQSLRNNLNNGTGNSVPSVERTNLLLLKREIMGVYCETHTNHTLCGQDAKVFKY